MKAKNQTFLRALFALIVLSLSLLTFSCSTDSDLENLTTADVKLNNSVKSVLKVIAKGAYLNGANGIDIGPDGNLYVGSVIGLQIVVMDKQNGKIIKRMGQDVGVKGPDDLVFGPDGSLYWTNILLGTVGRMKPDGSTSEQFVAPGVNPITFSPDGRLFVGLDFLGDGLYELDPDLVDPPRPIIVATEANPYPLGFFNAFDFGPDGYLYGPLFAAGMVIKVNVDPNNPVSTDPFGDGVAQVLATGLKNPASAKFDPQGKLTVIDQTGEVFKIDIQTLERTLFATYEPGLDNMVFDDDGTLYISNNDRGWVGEVLPSRQLRIISDGGLIAPQGLAVLPGSHNQDALFVADQYNLRQFNGLTGKEEKLFKASLLPGPGELISVQNVSTDGDNLIVSSWFSGELQVFNPKTSQVLEQYTMAVPIDQVRFKDDIAVSDLGLGGVVWASDHSMILPIDNTYVFAPGGLATDGETIWMADWGSGIIWEIGFDGKTPKAPEVLATGLSFPEGIAYENEGSLVVVETGTSRLMRINLSTKEVTTVVEGLELNGSVLDGYPPTWGFTGVAVGQSGDIYVSGASAEPNVIYRISKN